MLTLTMTSKLFLPVNVSLIMLTCVIRHFCSRLNGLLSHIMAPVLKNKFIITMDSPQSRRYYTIDFKGRFLSTLSTPDGNVLANARHHKLAHTHIQQWKKQEANMWSANSPKQKAPVDDDASSLWLWYEILWQ